jgi:4-alpha-glucanotransferase
VLRLGGEARMNTPGRAEGNWAWRLDGDLSSGPELQERAKEMREMIWLSDRLSRPPLE